MTKRAQQRLGGSLIALGPALILLSPWLVTSFPPLRSLVADEGFALMVTGECVSFSHLREWEANGSIAVLAILGVITLHLGLRLYLSAARHKVRFFHDRFAA